MEKNKNDDSSEKKAFSPGEIKTSFFTIEQARCHPETGECLLGKDQIMDAINSHKSIKQAAFILHDKDRYTEEEAKKNPKIKAGDLKNPHYHIVGHVIPSIELQTISRWFGVPVECVTKRKGRGALLDCTEYLTHENSKQQALGKALYARDEVWANFDFEAALDQRKEIREKYGKDVSVEEKMHLDVLYEGKTLNECAREDMLIYKNNFERFNKERSDYLCRRATIPPVRLNIYIGGLSGTGKSVLARNLAHEFSKKLAEKYPEFRKAKRETDSDIFFKVGNDTRVAFDRYDGQEVIIWSDARVDFLLRVLGCYSNIYDALDTAPQPVIFHKKYGNVNLLNWITIIEGITFTEIFLDEMSNAYFDKYGEKHYGERPEQIRRRIPIIVELKKNSYSIYQNEGFFRISDNDCNYQFAAEIRVSVSDIARDCSHDIKAQRRTLKPYLQPIIDLGMRAIETLYHKPLTEEELKEKYGKEITDVKKEEPA